MHHRYLSCADLTPLPPTHSYCFLKYLHCLQQLLLLLLFRQQKSRRDNCKTALSTVQCIIKASSANSKVPLDRERGTAQERECKQRWWTKHSTANCNLNMKWIKMTTKTITTTTTHLCLNRDTFIHSFIHSFTYSFQLKLTFITFLFSFTLFFLLLICTSCLAICMWAFIEQISSAVIEKKIWKVREEWGETARG